MAVREPPRRDNNLNLPTTKITIKEITPTKEEEEERRIFQEDIRSVQEEK